MQYCIQVEQQSGAPETALFSVPEFEQRMETLAANVVGARIELLFAVLARP